MADTVQRLMEEMVPELEDLQQKQIFNKAEIQSIVARRQSFEYKLRRILVSKVDFLRYLEYELNVSSLVTLRKQRLGVTKMGPADFGAMKRTSFIYERALRKFNNDVQLWMQYIAHSSRTGSIHALGRILPRAIQLNPKSVELWLAHSRFECETNNNIVAARAVLQRAIRLNTLGGGPLWHGMFDMELRYVVKLVERKRTMGLIDAGAAAKDEVVDDAIDGAEFDLRFKAGGVPTDAAASSSSSSSSTPSSDALSAKQDLALLSALIPRAIYRNAIASRSTPDLKFRLEFVKLIPSAYSAALSALDAPIVEAETKDNTDEKEEDVLAPVAAPSRKRGRDASSKAAKSTTSAASKNSKKKGQSKQVVESSDSDSDDDLPTTVGTTAPSSSSSSAASSSSSSSTTSSVTGRARPLPLSLASYAYNHNGDDILFTNFITNNGVRPTILPSKADASIDDNDESASSSSSSSPATVSYHVDFLPLFTDIFDSITRDFAADPIAQRVVSEFYSIKARIDEDADRSEQQSKSE